VKLRVERPGLLGAPVLTLDLLVYAPQGQVHGSGEITQALPPPYGQTHIPQITGAIHHTGFGQDEMLVSLTGQYVVSLPPPAIGSYLAHFSGALVVNHSWNGKGSFTYGGHTVADCTVTKI
jgi:hypothetical protein